MAYILTPPAKIYQEENQNAEIANLQIASIDCEKEDKDSPLIPEDVYTKLPAILKRGTEVFSVKREMDVFLTSALAVLSGCFPNVFGLYSGKKIYGNMNCFIIAPPASGKGRMIFSREMCELIHLHRMGKISGDDKPVKAIPLFIPGNISAAALVEQLNDSDGVGVICESEADTLTNAIKRDWGHFDDTIRKSFENEPISQRRRKEHEFIEIKTPKLACALSGTPNQVDKLVESVDNGLFSRMMFYCFEIPSARKLIGKFEGGVDLSTHFSEIAKEVFKLYLKVFQHGEIEFELSDSQFETLNTHCKGYDKEAEAICGNNANGIVFRLQNIVYKVCMLFSVLRIEPEVEMPVKITCTDDDLNTALSLSKIYLRHSLLVYQKLSKGKNPGLKGMENDIYNALLPEFSRKDALHLAREKGIHTKTLDNYLRKFHMEGLLIKLKQGKYQKVKK